MRSLVFLLLFALPASAQDGVRASDEVLNAAALQDLLSGHQIEFFDGSKSKYGPNGRYAYTYTDDGPAWTGQYRLSEDNLVCVDFDNGSARCDRFVQDGQRLVLIIEDGTRFPVRNRSVYAE